jgi:anti-repressor protein
MEQLIKVTKNENGDLLVSARELYKFLELSERFSKFTERMFEYGFEKDKDYTLYQTVHPQNKQTIDDYALTLDTAKELAMLQRTPKGKQARLYFIECEKEYQKLLAKPKELSRKELALLVIEIEEEREKLQETVELLHHTDKTYTSGELAKELNLKSAKQLNNLLHEKRVQFKKSGTWMLYSKYSGLDYVETKQEVTETGRVIYHRKWTNQGREFILRLLGKTLSV